MRPHPSVPRPAAAAAAALGMVVLVVTIGLFHIGSGPAVFLSVVVILGHVVRWLLHRWNQQPEEAQAW